LISTRLSRGAVALALAISALSTPHIAMAGGQVTPQRTRIVGSADTSAPMYFTVRLQPGIGPRQGDLVAKYFQTFGLAVRSDSDNGILYVRGTTGQVSAASGIRYGIAADSNGSRFVLALSRPAFPRAIASEIVATTLGGGPRAMGGGGATPSGVQVGPSTYGYTPAGIATYYDYGSIETSGKQAAGQSIAVVVCGAVDTTDVATYQSLYSLPSNAPASVQVDGGSVTTDFVSTAIVEVIDATAQSAAVTAYVLPNNCSDANVADATAQILTDTKTKKYTALVQAYGNFEDVYAYLGIGSELTAEDSDLKALLGKNVTTFAGNGDDSGFSNLEAGDPGVFYPGSDPNVITVGTTMALQNASGTRLFEPASYYSGGGPSADFAIPAWQKGVPGLVSKTQRNVPDVAFNGDCQLEYSAIYSDSYYEVCGSVYGDASWAGLLALIDAGRVSDGKARLTDVPSKIYAQRKVAGMFVDVTEGCNGVYCAGSGYDEVSGLGVPDATVLYNTMVALP
jgi:kumamolisin